MIRISLEETSKYRKLTEKDFIYNMNQAIAFYLEPEEENWEKVEYYGEAWIDPTESVYRPQYVYVLVNPSCPGISKIGFTTTTVYERVKSINSATGVITPWVPVFSYKCSNARMLETDIHEYLEQRGLRVNLKREGFEITSSDAIKIIEELGKKYK